MTHQNLVPDSDSPHVLGSVVEDSRSEALQPSAALPPLSSQKTRNPLPKVQLALVLLIQLAEPVVGGVIFPFVNHFVRSTGVIHGDGNKTGYFTGTIEACFYATEALCVLSWGRASDRYGRKPVLIIGLFGLTLSTIGFGLSTQYWSAVLARCAEGALCGNIGVAKSTIAEMTDPSNMAQAFSMLPMMWGLGGTIAPIIGGVFSQPAEKWPATMGQLEFFRQYPYFLPCAIAACVPLIAATFAFFLLKETHPTRMPLEDSEKPPFEIVISTSRQVVVSSPRCSEASGGTYVRGNVELSSSVSRTSTATVVTSASQDPPRSPSIRSLLDRRLLIAIANYSFLAYYDQCINVLVPLVYSSQRSQGGLHFNTFTIGVILAVWNIINGTFNILALPLLIRRFGVKHLFVASALGLTLSLAMFPVIGYVARRSDPHVVSGDIWAVIIVQLFFWIIASIGYGCIFVFINEDVADNARGTINGLAQMTVSLMRSLGSIVPSTLLSLSLQRNLVGGDFGYILLCVLAIGGIFLAFQLPNKPPPTKP